jgi:hypothetical protein
MTTTTNTNRETQIAQANEIARQIGNRAFFMMGAKNLMATEHEGKAALTFKIARNDNGVTHVRVVLEPSDTYTVQFLKVRNPSARSAGGIFTVSEADMVYSDSLNTCIEAHTGLRLSL